MSQDTRHAVALFVGRGLNALLLLANAALLGRLLGPAGFGQWSMLVAAATLLHTGLVNWTHPATVLFGTEEWQRRHSLAETLAARAPVVAAGLLVCLALVSVSPTTWLSRWFSVNPGLGWLVWLCVLNVWITAEVQATLQAMGRLTWQALFGTVATAAGTALLAALLWRAQAAFVLVVVSVLLVPSVLLAAVWVVLLVQSGFTMRAFRAAQLARQLRYAWPLVPTFIVGYVGLWGDQLILRYYWTDRDVGLFNLAYQLMLGLMSAAGPITTVVLYRLITDSVTTDDAARVYLRERMMSLFALWTLGAVWAVALLPPIVRLVAGASFQGAEALLLVLCVSVPCSVITSLYTVLFNLQHRLGRALVYAMIMTALNMAVSLTLVPAIGSRASAWSSALAYALVQVLYVQDQHRHLHLPSGEVYALFALTLLVGLGQWLAGPTIAFRLVWAALSTGVLISFFRVRGTVNPGLLDSLLPSRLPGIQAMIRSVLVGSARSEHARRI